MHAVLAFFAVVAAGYLFGSFPTSYIAGKAFRGIDIRAEGSGNTGATNVFRVMGPGPGILVLFIDIAKGWIPVFFFVPLAASASGIEGAGGWLGIAAGMGAICGHNWPVFLNFKGGKGVAVSVGALLGISPAPLGLAAAVWVIVFISSGYVSLGSMIASVSLPLFMNLYSEPCEVMWFGILIAVFIILRHRANIFRLMKGKENRFNLRKPLK